MLRYAAFALGTTMALGLPQVSVAQTVGQFIQPPVIGVQQPVVTVERSVVLVSEPVVAIEGLDLVDTIQEDAFARLPVAGSARDDSECYSPDRDGPRNELALPLCLDYLQQADGADQYDTLDRMGLADTRICSSGVNCGPPADLTNIRPFYGSAGAPAPLPQPVVAVAPPPPVVVAPAPAPVAFIPPPAPVPVALPAAGFGGAGLALGAAGLAALVGIVVLASDDDDNATSTTGSQ